MPLSLNTRTLTNQDPLGTYYKIVLTTYYSGFNKHSNSGNIIAHEVVDVRSGPKSGVGSTLQNNGNEIFNSGGYGGSQK